MNPVTGKYFQYAQFPSGSSFIEGLVELDSNSPPTIWNVIENSGTIQIHEFISNKYVVYTNDNFEMSDDGTLSTLLYERKSDGTHIFYVSTSVGRDHLNLKSQPVVDTDLKHFSLNVNKNIGYPFMLVPIIK